MRGLIQTMPAKARVLCGSGGFYQFLFHLRLVARRLELLAPVVVLVIPVLNTHLISA